MIRKDEIVVNEQNAVAIKEFDDSFYRVLIAFFRGNWNQLHRIRKNDYSS